MTIFNTTNISVNEVVTGFGYSGEPSMALLDVPSWVPQYWRVYNRTAISTTDTGERSLDQFQGGPYEPQVFMGTLTCGQGPDESGIFPNVSSVYGYNVVPGTTSYGSITGYDWSDEGWYIGQVAAVAEKVTNGVYGIIMTIVDWDHGDLFYTAEYSDFRLYGAGSIGYLYSSGADSDNTLYYSNNWLRQVWWYMGTNPYAPDNPFSGASFTTNVLRQTYG